MTAVRVIRADHQRSVDLPGAPAPVPRPVDIDQSATRFSALRTLRVYRFAPPSVIEGHAEEDEVFIVVLAGSIDLVMRSPGWLDNGTPFTLTAADAGGAVSCAAYLPRFAEYQLTARGPSDVAYARATAEQVRSPRIFAAGAARQAGAGGACVLLDERAHAERLRLCVFHIDARHETSMPVSIRAGTDALETLLHLRTRPPHGTAQLEAEGTTVSLESWDSAAIAPGTEARLWIAAGGAAHGLIVAAK